MSGPADKTYQVSLLLDRIAAIEERCRRLEEAGRTYAERARVSTPGGGSMCVVTYPSGATRTLPRLASYTPVLDDQVLILNSPAWSGVVGKVSV